MSKISIVIPCYNEQQTIPHFYEQVIFNLNKIENITFELLFVNDGSLDNTLNVIKSLRKKDKRIKYISFSRNFGKEAAIYAGLEYVSGDFIVVMDVDLQDPPELLLNMYQLIQEGYYDCIATRRTTRKGEPIIRSFFARCFYKIINRLSSIEMVDGARDYSMMTRQVVNAILSLKEYNRYSKGIFSFVGFNVKWLEYENKERIVGETKWSFWNLFKYAINGILSFSTKPLLISSFLGVLFCFVSFILIIFIILRTLLFGDPVGGWPSMVCILLFVSGIQLFCMGIIGQYLAKTYLEVKNRPIYIIKEKWDK